MMKGLLARLSGLGKRDEFVSVVITAVMLLVLVTFRPAWFMSLNNFEALQTAIAPSALIAAGMMVLLVTGNLDLSVGSNMAVSGIVCGYALVSGLPVAVAILCGLLCGIAIGALNGFLVTKLGIIPLIATIGTMYVFRGISEMVMTSSAAISLTGFPETFLRIGDSKLFGVYCMAYIAVAILLAVQLVLKRRFSGRKLYYIGGNAEGAKSQGFKVKKIIFLSYVFSGLLSSVAAILSVSYYQSASRFLGKDIQMQIIIACIIGGGSLAGGKGSAVGALIGVIFMSLLKNAFNLFEINVLWQSVVVGMMLVWVVVFDGVMYIRNQKLQGKR